MHAEPFQASWEHILFSLCCCPVSYVAAARRPQLCSCCCTTAGPARWLRTFTDKTSTKSVLRFKRCTGSDLITFSVDRMELASRTTCSAGGTEGGAYAATAVAICTPPPLCGAALRWAHLDAHKYEPNLRWLPTNPHVRIVIL